MSGRGWIGVDLDGTLAHYDEFEGPAVIGRPVGKMIDRVRPWIERGTDVRIFTARVWPIVGVIWPDMDVATAPMVSAPRGVTLLEHGRRITEAGIAAVSIRRWCELHLGRVLPITCCKDYSMVELWDDRVVQVIKNTGMQVGISSGGFDVHD